MKALTKWWMVGFVALALVGSACGDDSEEMGTDGGVTDTGTTDTGTTDTGTTDTGTTDTGTTDTGTTDTGTEDTGTGETCSLLPPEGQEPDACGACTASMCGTQFATCNAEEDCCNLIVCGVEAGCGTDQVCFLSMCGEFLAGADNATALGDCVSANCEAECGN